MKARQHNIEQSSLNKRNNFSAFVSNWEDVAKMLQRSNKKRVKEGEEELLFDQEYYDPDGEGLGYFEDTKKECLELSVKQINQAVNRHWKGEASQELSIDEITRGLLQFKIDTESSM